MTREVKARADVPGMRQETQFTCMAASLAAALRAHGKDVTEGDVNKVLGCQALRGANWEQALATAQYFGMRATLVVPATLQMLKDWTARGIPVLIAWNPEGRPWSHASTVYDVDQNDNVYVMDPNIPDPSLTTRIVSKQEFYQKWIEPVGDSLIVRRPAVAIEREVTPEGRQVRASRRTVAQEAMDGYLRAITDLEASADLVVVATNKLRSLGVEPKDNDYPFAQSIETVASDIYRWRGAVDRRYRQEDIAGVAHKVALKHASRKP